MAALGRATRERVRCDAGPFSWVTSHTFRKTVATRLDEAHLTARQIADQLGHAHPSLTQDAYMGRRVVVPKQHDSWIERHRRRPKSRCQSSPSR
jgi:integrase